MQGTEAQQLQAFRETLLAMRRRIELLLALPLERIDRHALQEHARQLVGG